MLGLVEKHEPYLCSVLKGLGYRDIMHVLTWGECIIYELELD